MTRVLVLGRRGLLARSLAGVTWPMNWSVDYVGRDSIDLNNIESIESFIRGRAPDIVINTAAYTEVDRAEGDFESACRLNALAPEAIAQATRLSGALLIHMSSDYVFGGEDRAPYSEDDPVAPVNAYGRSKAEGERRVLQAYPEATIARTAWLISPESGFVPAILARAMSGAPLKVVNDQRGNPTRASDLADALTQVARNRLSGKGSGGALHMAGSADASWYDIATHVLRAAAPEAQIRPVSSSDYVLPAQRPRDSRLYVMRLETIHDIALAPWSDWIVDTARVGLTFVAKRVEKGQQSGG